jgi:hypothetical protein
MREHSTADDDAPRAKSGRRNRSRNSEDELDRDEKPRKKPKKRKKKTAFVLILGLMVGGGLVLVVAVSIGLYFLLRTTPPTNIVAAPLKKPADPAPVKKADPAHEKKTANLPTGWQEIRSSSGRFVAAMPQPFTEKKRIMQSPAGPIEDYQYLYETTVTYSITYSDFTNEQLKKVSLEKVIDSGREAILIDVKGKLLSEKKIELEGRTGREIVISVPPERLIVRYYIDGPRLYSVLFAGPNADASSNEGRAYFGSFHFSDAKNR